MRRTRPAAAALLLALALWGCAGGAPRPDIAVPPPPESQGASPSLATDLARQGPYLPDAALRLCVMQISNGPEADTRGYVSRFSPLIRVNERVILATAPANNACLSSGFGPRFGRVHEGMDLQAKPAATIFSAGPGRVREAGTARGYGRQVVIDHGHGVFTRYAHLAEFAPGIRAGTRIGFGQPLGRMGESGNATAVHLHYEVLTGSWGPKGSYGLTPHDPLSFPAYEWQDSAS
jgi:murein DD-endopeptidase MepM/ murein hydrolase activator NlpD